MRDKDFYINSIKMDLYRVVHAAGDITKEFPLEHVLTFLNHANKDFDKIELTEREKKLQNEINDLLGTVSQNMKDPHKRLRWTEKVLTVRSRL